MVQLRAVMAGAGIVCWSEVIGILICGVAGIIREPGRPATRFLLRTTEFTLSCCCST